MTGKPAWGLTMTPQNRDQDQTPASDRAVTERYRPTPDEIKGLLSRASGHPLGTEFLLKGDLDAVAATFGAHAFVVDAARDHLRTAEPAAEPPPTVGSAHT